MQLFGRNLQQDVAIVAEIGVNHEGSEESALKLIDLAIDAGADAVKLQTYTPERYASASDPARLARVTRFSLSPDAHRRLARHAEKRGGILFSTALTEDVVPFLAEWCPVIKVASGDLVFEPTIRAVAATNKPVIISTGNATVDEIDAALGWFRDEAGPEAVAQRVIIMHCVASYPAPIEQANILSVPYLQRRFGLQTGYSNHVVEPEAIYAAVALGATVIEAHFTDQKHGREFRDHAMSFSPEEFAEMVVRSRRIRASLGLFEKKPEACERPLRNAMRKGLIAARDIAAGEILTAGALIYARPAGDFSAADLPSLLGRTLAAPLGRGESITLKHLRET